MWTNGCEANSRLIGFGLQWVIAAGIILHTLSPIEKDSAVFSCRALSLSNAVFFFHTQTCNDAQNP